jgi:hypothetical protein
MRAILSTLVLGLSFVAASPAAAAVGDPELIIYRFAGVRDNGGAVGVGITTVFLCTNFSGVDETVRWVTRADSGTLLSNTSLTVSNTKTVAVATHGTAVYPANVFLNTGVVVGGTTAVAATSVFVTCTALVLDAGAATPSGITLHGVRLNPSPGSEE